MAERIDSHPTTEADDSSRPSAPLIAGLKGDQSAAAAAMAQSERSKASTDNSPLSLIGVAAKSAVYSGIEAPIEGVAQLVNHVAGTHLGKPDLISPPEQAEFGTARWYASTIGSGVGFVAPFLLTQKLTGALGEFAGNVAESQAWERMPLASRFLLPAAEATSKLSTTSPFTKSLIDGAIVGGVFSPSNEQEGNFWAQRAVSAAASTAMFGVQSYGARTLTSALQGGMESELSGSMVRNVGMRLGINAASGSLGGMASSEVGSLLSGNGFASADSLKESAVAAAATGFALDAVHIAQDARRNSSSANAAQVEQTAQRSSTQMDSASVAPLHSDSAIAEPYSTIHGDESPRIDDRQLKLFDFPAFSDSPVKTEPYSLVGEQTDPSHALFGAKQYRSESGKEFWQTDDGKIHYQIELKSNKINHVWTPFGSEQNSFFELPPANGADGPPRTMVRDDGSGEYIKPDGRPVVSELVNEFAFEPPAEKRIVLPAEQLDAMVLPKPSMEPDFFSQSRLLPAADGREYLPSELTMRTRKAGVDPPPPGTILERLNNDFTELTTQPARTYYVLSTRGVEHYNRLSNDPSTAVMSESQYKATLADLQKQTTKLVVPEAYAQTLDAVRELRKLAVLTPDEHPQMAADILDARRQLFLSPYANRLLPEHMGQYMERLPDPSLVKELVLVDHSKPDDWIKEAQVGKSHIMADADTATGRVRFFGDYYSAEQTVPRTILHEWSHLVEPEQADLLRAYGKAIKLEQFLGRKYGGENVHENWAVHSAEMFMDPNPELFLTLARQAPIRSVLLAEGIQRALNNGASDSLALDRQSLQARLDYVKTQVLPQARTQFTNDFLLSGDSAAVGNATAFLDSLMRSPEHRGLAEQLVDRGKLLASIDRFESEKTKSGSFDYDSELRRAIRLNALESLDNSAFTERQSRYQDIVAKLKAFNMTYLLSPDPGKTNDALQAAEVLSINPDRLSLFVNVFDRQMLGDVALTSKDPAVAKRAFDVLYKAFGRHESNNQFIDKMVVSNSPARSKAALVALDSADGEALSRTTAVLRQQIARNDLSAFDETTTAALQNLVDGKLAVNLNGKDFHPQVSIRTLQRAELLQQLEAKRPIDPETSTRIHERTDQLTKLTADWLSKRLLSTNEMDRKGALDVIASLEKSPYEQDRSLSRKLLSREVLEQAAMADTSQANEVIGTLARLYPERTTLDPTLMRIANENPNARNASLFYLLHTNSAPVLRAVQSMIADGVMTGTVNHNLMLSYTGATIDAAGKVKDANLTPGYVERLQIRLQLAQDLLKHRFIDQKIAAQVEMSALELQDRLKRISQTRQPQPRSPG